MVLLLSVCSEDSTANGMPAPSEPASPVEATDLAERAKDPRPSVLLIVIDTLRADAVSAYGAVDGTTPNFDALAERGILYRNAFASAPWTVSSHASLFTGLRVDEHGVGLSADSMAPDSLSMLAESFADAGYVTAGFAENPLVGPLFGLDQGFDHFEVKPYPKARLREAVEPEEFRNDENDFRLVDRVSEWAAQRDRSRPYFLFINIMDAHAPYQLRDENLWVPSGVDPVEVDYVAKAYWSHYELCGAVPRSEHVAILQGLYLGDVAAADAKLGRLIERSRRWEGSKTPLTLVTGDHGEHFGEHNLMGHMFSVRVQALHVPLVIEGLEGSVPGTIRSAVGLVDVSSALRCWALEEDCGSNWPLSEALSGSLPESLPGAVEGNPAETSRAGPPLFSFYSDATAIVPPEISGVDELVLPEGWELVGKHRNYCLPKDRVFGEMVSMIRYPMKINWVEDQPIELYDLSWDPAERSNLAEVETETAAELRAELEVHLQERILSRNRPSGESISEETVRALKSLGYIE